MYNKGTNYAFKYNTKYARLVRIRAVFIDVYKQTMTS